MGRAAGSALVLALLLAACSAAPTSAPAPEASPVAPTSPSEHATATSPAPGPASTAPPDDPSTPTTAAASPTPSPSPTFDATVEGVAGTPVADRIVGVSWREGCPVGLESLRYVQLDHHTPDGGTATGELVVHADVVDDVLAAFGRLFALGFPIARMELVDAYGADDQASMRANNTSAFNCRFVAGTERWSNHAFGTAVDLNPLWNPYVRGGAVDPPEGAPWADRTVDQPGMLHPGSPEVAAFTDLGWDWGGAWASGADYQHVSATGG